MKKIFTLLASLLMYSAVWAQSPILSEGGVNYYVLDEDAKTAVASGTDAISGDLVIRSKVGEYTVTKMLPLSSRVGLTGISIPATITDIEYGTFQSCTSLTKIVVDADNQNYTSSVNGTEYNALMSKDGTIFYSGCKTSVIPPSVTTIIQYAFLGCTGLTSIVIPMNVISIEKDAFYGCTDMTDVYCWANPSNLTWTDYSCDDFKADKGTTCHVLVNYLSTYKEKWSTGNTSQLGNGVNVTFEGDLAEWVSESNCYKKDDVNYYLNSDGLTAYVGSSSNANGTISILSEVGGGYPVTSIGDEAFYNCYDLTSIIIPETIISIGEDAFLECIKLANITIPEGVESIGEDAFSACKKFTRIFIPTTVTFIGEGAFSDCSSITTMEVAADNQRYTSTVNGIACNAILSKDGTTLLNGCMNSVVPAGVTSIAASAFYNCDGLTSLTLPASVTSIGARAFEDCDGFTSLTLPTSVTSIGKGAFSYCRNLKSFIIPANVTSIEDDAFFRCDNLKDVYCWANPNNLTWNDNNCNDFIVKYWYSNDYKITNCHVPAEYLSIYERNWSTSDTGGEGTDVNVKFEGDLVVLEDKAANTFTTSSDIQVVLSGRTLYRDGYWNTICLPFDVDIKGSVLKGATVKTLTDATLTDGTLTLNFADATDANDEDEEGKPYMEAGKPYIIRWGTPEDHPSTDLINPVFEDVDITAAEPSSVVCKDENEKTVITFQGLYNCRNFTATDNRILYLGSNNTLYYPKPAEGSTMTIGAFRALFQLGEGITAGEPSAASQIKAFVMNFGDEGNGISEIHADPSSDAGWYTIDGRRLMEEPKDRGMYIHKGRKMMIK